jgi:hypothetical protein
MPVLFGLLIATVLLFASGFAKGLVRGGSLVPADFNFGVQAALTALLFAIDNAVANRADLQPVLQSAGVIAVSTLSLLAALKLSQLHNDWSARQGASRRATWAAWTGSNLFGYVCVVLVIFLKYPV